MRNLLAIVLLDVPGLGAYLVLRRLRRSRGHLMIDHKMTTGICPELFARCKMKPSDLAEEDSHD